MYLSHNYQEYIKLLYYVLLNPIMSMIYLLHEAREKLRPHVNDILQVQVGFDCLLNKGIMILILILLCEGLRSWHQQFYS